ncbi:histidine phosphatase family protein [Lutimaribacter marinistellae]|uniref:Histidine phosphatase family protein n=1 Tax=Lutimaribacter marinistellae TaxID=1820329 RepID=A0ABV7TLM0_9RHOB
MRHLLATILLCLAALAHADDWDALDQPGAFALMRHALAPGTGDPANFEIGRCETQRNLDAQGRAQAETIGAAFRDRGIAFDAVWSSQWCRCEETAELLDLGTVELVPAFNSFFGNRSRGPAQTREALDLIAAQTGRVMIVTHQVNITALTGEFPRSGEVFVVRPAGDRLDVIGKILISP